MARKKHDVEHGIQAEITRLATVFLCTIALDAKKLEPIRKKGWKKRKHKRFPSRVALINGPEGPSAEIIKVSSPKCKQRFVFIFEN